MRIWKKALCVSIFPKLPGISSRLESELEEHGAKAGPGTPRKRGTPARGMLTGVPFGNDLGLLTNSTGITDQEAKQSWRNFGTLITSWPKEVRVRRHPAKGWMARRSPLPISSCLGTAPSLAMKNTKMQGFDKVCTSKSGDVTDTLVFLSSCTLSLFLSFWLAFLFWHAWEMKVWQKVCIVWQEGDR